MTLKGKKQDFKILRGEGDEASLEEFIARDAVGLLRYNYNNFLG